MSANHAARLEAKFRHAVDLHQQGKRQQAHKLYRAVLNARPDHSGALHYLGLLSYQQGDSETAMRLMRSALQRQPDYFDAVMSLGNVLQEQKRFKEAAECYQQAVKLRPAEAAAFSNLSVSLRRQDLLDDAISTGRKAVELDPQYVLAWYNLGNAYKVAQQYEQAIESYQRAIQLKPDLSLAHDSLCQSTFQLECRNLPGQARYSKTQLAYEQWLACEPDNTLAKFMLEAVSGDGKHTRAPDDVVRSMFDQFADSFESHLQSLQYNFPQALPAQLIELLGPPSASLNVLDAGCGTGLCAGALKPWAKRLIGVDISGDMLAKARQKNIYDALFEEELTHFLHQYPGAFDLIVCADTLCYFGNLEEVLQAAHAALGSNGAVLFTLEASPASRSGKDEGCTLHPTGRYSHAESYVAALMPACGFSQVSSRHDSTRKEFGKAVPGLVVSARKL